MSPTCQETPVLEHTKENAGCASISGHSSPEKEPADWTEGHQNHLTPEQEVKLSQFKSQCDKAGLKNASDNGSLDVSDATILRFLRSVNFDVDHAFSRFYVAEERRRKKHGLEKFYENVDIPSYETSRRMFSQWTGRRDNHGFPIFVFPVKNFTKSKIENWISALNSSHPGQGHDSLSPHVLHFEALFDNLLHFTLPLCSQLPRPNMDVPISASTHIIDITGVGVTHFWKIRAYLQAASALASTYYPETLGHVFIIGASSFFITIWDIVKKWFDPPTLLKIHILSPSETTATLLAHIAPEDLPKQYGGTLQWEWGNMPNLDAPAMAIAGGLYSQKENGEREYLQGPLRVTDDAIQLLGTIDGKERRGSIPLTKPTGTSESSQGL
ncbi:uncharacterized protein N7482_003634 [Penicillium canariense]|uniref:CRAL-TRIO domain-containing protein n=1 Tax=Penicillium canariense TaxID=189055 RepID=A0A9W9LPH9_9EURO|nr:uncharacterized protein N7482_003634 [Penicillium canariense]KAJ5168040.1 hypothetical protein N7482_003634 [Penicillium canariense]